MTLTPQPYPLWLAQVIDDEIQAGRIIGWLVGDPGISDPDALAHPVVIFSDDDGYVWATMQASRTAARFVCEHRAPAVRAAEKWILARSNNGRTR